MRKRSLGTTAIIAVVSTGVALATGPLAPPKTDAIGIPAKPGSDATPLVTLRLGKAGFRWMYDLVPKTMTVPLGETATVMFVDHEFGNEAGFTESHDLNLRVTRTGSGTYALKVTIADNRCKASPSEQSFSIPAATSGPASAELKFTAYCGYRENWGWHHTTPGQSRRMSVQVVLSGPVPPTLKLDSAQRRLNLDAIRPQLQFDGRPN